MSVAVFRQLEAVDGHINQRLPKSIPHLNVKMVGIDVNDIQLKLIRSKLMVFSCSKREGEHILDFSTPSVNDVKILEKILNFDIDVLIGKYVLMCE